MARYDVIDGRTYRKIVRTDLGGNSAEIFIHKTTGTWYNAKSWSQPDKLRPYTGTPDVVNMWNARLAASGVTARVEVNAVTELTEADRPTLTIGEELHWTNRMSAPSVPVRVVGIFPDVCVLPLDGRTGDSGQLVREMGELTREPRDGYGKNIRQPSRR